MTGTDTDRIVNWLQQVPTLPPPPHRGLGKRSRSSYEHSASDPTTTTNACSPSSQRAVKALPSPPRTATKHEIDDMPPPVTPRKKRKTLAGGAADEHAAGDDDTAASDDLADLTPRPLLNHNTLAAASCGSPVSSKNSSVSNAPSISQGSETTGRSSPKKQKEALSLHGHGVDLRNFDLEDTDISGELVDLYHEMRKVSLGLGVVPSRLRDTVLSRSHDRRSHFYVFNDASFSETTTQAPGHGSLDTELDCAVYLSERARSCYDQQQDEAGWNNHVHTPLLHSAIYGNMVSDKDNARLSGFLNCTSARINSRYKIAPDLPGKKVDYVLFIHPEKDTDDSINADALIKQIRSDRRHHTINMTDFSPLLQSPIAVGIETKRNGGNQDPADIKARLQIGVWHAAQWRWLHELAGVEVPQGGDSSERGREKGSAAENTEVGLKGLTFLPSVIVQGHEWRFVASTFLPSGKTVLWGDIMFGTTKSPLDTFQVTAGISLLARWAEDVYWPWYKQHVLHPAQESLASGS